MKHLIPLILLVVLGCSKTPLDQAKKGVSSNIGQYLNDPGYYESVSWGSLDSAFYEYFYDTPRGGKYFDSVISSIPLQNERYRVELNKILKYKPIDKKGRAVMNFFIDKEGMSTAKAEIMFRSCLKDYYEERDKFKPFFKGYTISHTFRARGQKKEKVLMKYRFTLDSTFNVIDAEKQEVDAFD